MTVKDRRDIYYIYRNSESVRLWVFVVEVYLIWQNQRVVRSHWHVTNATLVVENQSIRATAVNIHNPVDRLVRVPRKLPSYLFTPADLEGSMQTLL